VDDDLDVRDTHECVLDLATDFDPVEAACAAAQGGHGN